MKLPLVHRKGRAEARCYWQCLQDCGRPANRDDGRWWDRFEGAGRSQELITLAWSSRNSAENASTHSGALKARAGPTAKRLLVGYAV